MTDRNKPGVALWATVSLVVVLIGYPLSIGPMVWIAIKLGAPPWIDSAMGCIYAPANWAMNVAGMDDWY